MGRMIPMTPPHYRSLITLGRLLDNMTAFQLSRVGHAGGPVRWASVRTHLGMVRQRVGDDHLLPAFLVG